MKYAIALFLTLIVASAMSLAQEEGKDAAAKAAPKQETLHGYVVDAMCAAGISKKENVMEKAAGHSKSCALEDACTASGYGVFSDSKWFKFDDGGDKLAKGLVEKTKSEKAIMVDVTGTQKGDRFVVASIKESSMGKMKKKDASTSSSGHEGMH